MKILLLTIRLPLIYLLLIFVAPMCLAQDFFEYADFKENNVFYKIQEDSSTVKVCYANSLGAIYFPSYSGDIVIPGTVTQNGKTYEVTGIVGGAFYMCDELTSVSISNNVKNIEGYGVMYGGYGIKNPWGGSYYAGTFGSCTSLRSIDFPDSLTEIGSYTCNYCTSLSEINLPETLVHIGDNAFSWCTSLNWITIPDNVTSIGSSSFSDCSNIKSIHIGKSLNEISGSLFDLESSFENCSGIENINVSSENVTFDSREDCNAIIEKSTNRLILGCKKTIIPSSVTEIGNSAFKGCIGLTSIVIPDAVTSIGYEAFLGCTGLEEINLHDRINTIEDNAFVSCTGLKRVTIGKSVSSIGKGAFWGCKSLKLLNFNAVQCAAFPRSSSPHFLTDFPFTDCSIEEIHIGDDVQSIPKYFMEKVKTLTKLDIGKSVTSIGDYAFDDCEGLNDVYSYINDPTTVSMGHNVFTRYPNNYSQRTLHVPVGTVSAYQEDTKWSQYFGPIVEMEQEVIIPGDVNGDGEVNIADVNAVIDIIVGGVVTSDVISRIDVNGDGEVNIADINAIIEKILGS